jgi:ABC-type Fe3+/spermidine/putrescine transport system ATPase subunit
MPLLCINDITKTYDSRKVLDRVSLTLGEGDILCLLGPSGCGKTTLLRVIAGLEKPDEGTVVFDEEDMMHVTPHKRRFGMMFQEFALFPHKDVFGNVSFGLRMLKLDPAEVTRRTHEMLDLMGLSGFAHRNVSELSGGERQRVALARSLAPRPRLLLLDEPLGSLDRALRERLMVELKSVLKTVGLTSVFVTHDQAEAFAIADVIAVIMDGHIVQIARPESLYRHPANETIARFLGLTNIIAGRLGSGGEVSTPIGSLSLQPLPHEPGGRVVLLIQPDAARVLGAGNVPDEKHLHVSGTVKNYLFRGKGYSLEMTLPDGTLLSFDLPDDAGLLKIGRQIMLAIDPEGITII